MEFSGNWSFNKLGGPPLKWNCRMEKKSRWFHFESAGHIFNRFAHKFDEWQNTKLFVWLTISLDPRIGKFTHMRRHGKRQDSETTLDLDEMTLDSSRSSCAFGSHPYVGSTGTRCSVHVSTVPTEALGFVSVLSAHAHDKKAHTDVLVSTFGFTSGILPTRCVTVVLMMLRSSKLGGRLEVWIGNAHSLTCQYEYMHGCSYTAPHCNTI